MHEERRPVLGPDARVALGGLRRPDAQDHAMQQRLPDRAWNLHHPRVRQKLRKVTAHRARGRRIRRTEVDQQDAQPRRAVVGKRRFGKEAAHWTPTLAASLNSAAALPPKAGARFAPWGGPAALTEGPPPLRRSCGVTLGTVHGFAAMYAASPRAARARIAARTGGSQPSNAPLAPSAIAAQRHRLHRSTWRAMRPSWNSNVASIRL